MLEADTRVTVTLVPLPGKSSSKHVSGRLVEAYHGLGPVYVRNGSGEVTVVPAERVLLVSTRREH